MPRGRTRVHNACQRCRKQKIKCSGIPPCRTCLGRGLGCDFGAEDKHVVISERELFNLRSRVNQLENPHPDNQDQNIFQRASEGALVGNTEARPQSFQCDTVTETDTWSGRTRPPGDFHASRSSPIESVVEPTPAEDAGDGAQSNVTNPLVPEQPTYIQETTGELRYLGHSSTYAFTQQVLQMLQRNPPSNPSPEIFMSPDGIPYTAEAHRIVPLATPDISHLPSRESALNYLQHVKFRTQPLLYLFDEADFNPRLQRFYKEPAAFAQANLVWYIHCLILMAFGKALDPYTQLEGSPALPVPGYLTRALSLLPDMSYLANHPIDATELLSCIALYLHSIDHRRAAVLYLGLSLRMAHLFALHLDLQESIVGQHVVERGRRVWWTVYALNQKLTSNMGLPNFLNDQDIFSPPPLPSESDEDDTAGAIHVRICQLLGLSISRVYGSSDMEKRSFVSTTRMILRKAARIADEVKKYSEACFGEISRVAAHLELSYHQCIILTCRPVLFCLMKSYCEIGQNSQTASPSLAMKGLIQVCVDSAVHAVQTLHQLKQHNLLGERCLDSIASLSKPDPDSFLPFDLECCFSAAFTLTIAAHVYPNAPPPSHSTHTAKEVIDVIAARGNLQAKLRRLEIERLEEMLGRRMQPFQQPEVSDQDYEQPMVTMTSGTRHDQPLGYDNPYFGDLDFSHAFSGHQMMDLAEAISIEDFHLLG